MGFFRRIASATGGVIGRIGSAAHRVLGKIGSTASNVAHKARELDDASGGVIGDLVRSVPFGQTALKGADLAIKGVNKAAGYAQTAANVGNSIKKYGDTGQLNLSRYK